MCLSHNAMAKKDSGYVDDSPKKHIKRVSQNEFERGDPDFVDERTTPYKKPKEKKGFLESLLDDE
ncbi:hypothetical protein KJ877_10195 [bacterium]|nr:hypothetical protein [bacterium]MBU1991139.1 hypothetical protein [bacterium]